MARTCEGIRKERQRLKVQYGGLYNSISALLFRHDPIGIAFENPNTDEYEPEVGTILPRLKACHSVEEVHRVVCEEFVRWFGLQTAGPEEHYKVISSEIWQVWNDYKKHVEPYGVVEIVENKRIKPD